MKWFLILLSAIFFSCSEKEEEIIELPFFELSETILSFESKGGVRYVDVKSNREWEMISVLPSWILMDVESDESLSFQILPNDGPERNIGIVFMSNNEEYTLLIRQNAKEKLSFVGMPELVVGSNADVLKIEVEQNVSYTARIEGAEGEWLSRYSKFGDVSFGNTEWDILSGSVLQLELKRNETDLRRSAKVIIHNEKYQLSDTLCIIQEEGTGIYVDGEYRILQQSELGDVNLIIMGDGFTRKDLQHEGWYEQKMIEAKSHFFSIEPYKTYRDYFNVYMVVAESEEEGVGEKNLLGGSSINNKFGTAFGSGTEIICDSELIFEYAHKVKELPENKPITVIVVLNSTKYAGTAYLYADGNSIALCPMSTEVPPNDFEGIVHHEAGGHAFGYLCDEYIYYERNIPESRKEGIREWQELGFQMNLDFTDNPNEVLWKDFIGIDKYDSSSASS